MNFYDDDLRVVSEENLLRGDELAMVGQRVYAADGDGDFTAGIVTGCDVDCTGRFKYTVARDDRDIYVTSERILLTESQARQIRLRCGIPATTSNGGGPSTTPSTISSGLRATRSRTRAAATRDSPVPSGSGTQQQRSGRSVRSTSDSEDETQESELNLEQVTDLEPEVLVAYDGCIQLKGILFTYLWQP